MPNLNKYKSSGPPVYALTGVIDFLLQHPTPIAILASAWWFYIGYGDLQEGKRNVGLQWQLLGIALSLGFCIGAAFLKMWLSLAATLPVA